MLLPGCIPVYVLYRKSPSKDAGDLSCWWSSISPGPPTGINVHWTRLRHERHVVKISKIRNNQHHAAIKNNTIFWSGLLPRRAHRYLESLRVGQAAGQLACIDMAIRTNWPPLSKHGRPCGDPVDMGSIHGTYTATIVCHTHTHTKIINIHNTHRTHTPHLHT